MCQIDMQKLADDARFNRFHAKVLLWCLLILIIDGYDIAVVGIALPSIMQQMGVNASTAGFMASSALFGMMFGAMVLGTLSDRIGRRWGPFVVSCGSQQSESLVVVEPGGHVGRLPLSLSTCPRGGCREHGFERWN